MPESSAAVLEFWFETLEPGDWWRKDDSLDRRIRSLFSDTHAWVAAGKAVKWRETDQGRLAEIIVLDQFSRNMYRDRPQAFAFDEMARKLSWEAIETGSLERLEQAQRGFLLMPLMHSETLDDHYRALPLFERYTGEGTLTFEKRHLAIIERFGRYPHRNAILGRESTAEEQAFLQQPGSSF